jgi:hypothetical protein
LCDFGLAFVVETIEGDNELDPAGVDEALLVLVGVAALFQTASESNTIDDDTHTHIIGSTQQNKPANSPSIKQNARQHQTQATCQDFTFGPLFTAVHLESQTWWPQRVGYSMVACFWSWQRQQLLPS